MSSGKWRPFCLGLNVSINVLKDYLIAETNIYDSKSENIYHNAL